jgi:5-methyltetrahydrofolate--homocysteine methyltransferase
VARRNRLDIQELARKQVEAGAHYININVDTLVGQEAKSLKWFVETIQAAVDVPLCLNSQDPNSLKAALNIHRGKAMINFIADEKEKYDAILSLVLEYKAKVIAMCINDSGMPKNFSERIQILNGIIKNLTEAGVPTCDIYLDPLVRPINADNTGTCEALTVLSAIEYVSEELYPVNTVIRLSSLSCGLPKRKLLNQTFFIMAMTKGLNTVILDPLDKKLMDFLRVSQALSHQDECCME